MPSEVGFLSALFDFSFTNLITKKIIRLLYIISVIAYALLALAFVITSFNVNAGFGVFTLLILAPLLFLLAVIYVRVMLELIMVLFRISDHVAFIAEQKQQP